MSRFALFVFSDNEYCRHMTALLNSLEHAQQHDVDVHVIGYGIDARYIADAVKSLPYKITFHKAEPITDLEHEIAQTNNNLYCKQTRFKYIRELGVSYDAICIMDADMFVVSENFYTFFELVAGTRRLIGCEEAYKWKFDSAYQYEDGAPILDREVKALKFHCSVPVFFDLKHWLDVFASYESMTFNAWERRTDKTGHVKIKRVGDIYSWNLSVYKCHRENDVVLLPMHSMTQVHGTAGAFWCAIKQHQQRLYCSDGCEVYCLHGRVGNPGYASGQEGWFLNALKSWGIEPTEKIMRQIWRSIRLVENEWVTYSFKKHLKLNNHFQMHRHWNKLLERYDNE